MLRTRIRVTLATLLAVAFPATVHARQATLPAAREAAWTVHQALAHESLFRNLAWRPVGPVKTGARIEAIAIPRGNTGTIYAGVGTGNLWKTVNNGLTWKPIFEHESAFAIGDVAVAPSNPDIVWVGTGEAQPRFAGYAYSGTGVFKSVNGGNSWTHMGLGGTAHIGKVLIHPTNPNIVYVAAMGRQWTSNPERGVFRTRDGGAHWERVLFVDDSTGVIDLVMDPGDPRTLYAWAWQIEEGKRGGLFKSTDGGSHWRRITAGLPAGVQGRANLDVAPSNPKVLYLYLDNRTPSTAPAQAYIGGEVYRSADRGEHWIKANTDDLSGVFGVFGWKFADVRVDPRNANHLYILGNRAFQSFDAGATWRRLGDRILQVQHTDGRALHLDHHELVIDPANPDRLLLGNDGGLYMSYDGGESWLHLNNIPVAQMYFVSVDDHTPYRIFAGTQDNAAVYGPSTTSLDDAVPDLWRSVYLDRWTGGDSYVTLLDPTDERMVYYEHQNGGIMRMNITGGSVLSGGPSSESIRPRVPRGAPPVRFSWYTPFFISPFDSKTLYAGGNQVFKSTDRGANWAVVSPDLGDAAGGDRAVVPTGALTMLAESPRVRGMLAGGTEGGRVWLTLNDGQTWRRIDAALPRKWVSRVALSAHDAARLYVSFTGYREDDARPLVFVSTDTGRSWRSIAANLPLESVNVIKEDPTDADILYVGTDLGVYVSRDRGGRWESLSATLPTTPVMDLTIQLREGELVIGTYGRGAWLIDLAPVRDHALAAGGAPLRLYPMRDVTLDWFPWETVPGDRRGRRSARVQVAAAAAGRATIAVQDSAGRAVRHWEVELERGANTIVWDLQASGADGELKDAAAATYVVEVRQGAARVAGSLVLHPDPLLAARAR